MKGSFDALSGCPFLCWAKGMMILDGKGPASDGLLDVLGQRVADWRQGVANSRTLRLALLYGVQFAGHAARFALYLAVTALVEETTRSSEQMGLMVLISMLPSVLFGLLGGVLADHLHRIKVMVWGGALRALISLGVALLAQAEVIHSTMLLMAYAANFCIATVAQLTMAVEQSLFPVLVSKEELLPIHSVAQAVAMIGQGAGLLVIGPFLFQRGGITPVAAGSAAVFLIGAVLAAFLPQKLGEPNGDLGRLRVEAMWHSMVAGLRCTWQRERVRWALGHLALAALAMGALLTLLPGLAARAWDVPTAFVAYVAIPIGVAFGLSIWLIGWRGQRSANGAQSISALLRIGLVSMGIGLGLIALLPNLAGWNAALFALMSLLLGAGLAMVMVPGRTCVQQNVPDEMQGRVISTQLLVMSVASTLLMPVIGMVADRYGFRVTFAGLGALTLLFWLITHLKVDWTDGEAR